MPSSKTAKTDYFVLNLQDIIEEEGEDFAEQLLGKFSCPLDDDIESFVKNKAIDFSKQSIARTYLVFKENSKQLVGIIALAQKSLSIPLSCMHGKPKALLKRFGKYDEQSDKFDISLTLIAQLGKNFNNNMNSLITGDWLLKIACDLVRRAQRIIGGRLTYLECKPIDKLVEFYNRNGFMQFSPDGNPDDKKLIQLIKCL